jgi:hypothetical protein
MCIYWHRQCVANPNSLSDAIDDLGLLHAVGAALASAPPAKGKPRRVRFDLSELLLDW